MKRQLDQSHLSYSGRAQAKVQRLSNHAPPGPLWTQAFPTGDEFARALGGSAPVVHVSPDGAAARIPRQPAVVSESESDTETDVEIGYDDEFEDDDLYEAALDEPESDNEIEEFPNTLHVTLDRELYMLFYVPHSARWVMLPVIPIPAPAYSIT